MLISEYFANKQIFVTGASGFIGQALLEKLLYSCANFECIYVLIRSRKQLNAQQRLEQLLQSNIFDRARQQHAGALKKVIAIAGDCLQLGLGISAEDLLKLQNVQIVFHSAASVRFDDALSDAVLMNMRGTHEVVKIALGMQQLQAFVHVSTTYCNPDHIQLEEKVYPAKADWRETIKLAENCSSDVLNYLAAKYSNHELNNYTFTKGLSEQIVQEYADCLPVLIFRPSIVFNAISEPVPGWINNFNGPIGIMVACGLGILHTNHIKPDNPLNLIPVDTVVRALIVAAYKRGIETTKSLTNQQSPEVINCSIGDILRVSNKDLTETGKRLIKYNPFEQTIYVPSGAPTSCVFWHYMRFIGKTMLVTCIVDMLLCLSRQKPMLFKLQRRIVNGFTAINAFLNTDWIFHNDNLYKLNQMVAPQELASFEFINYSRVDFDTLLIASIRGVKEYLLHESPDVSRKALRRRTFLNCLSYAIFLLVTFCSISFVYSYACRHWL